MVYMFSLPNILRSTFSNMCSLCSCALIYIEIAGADGSVYDPDSTMMVSQWYTYLGTHQIVHIKYLHLFV